MKDSPKACAEEMRATHIGRIAVAGERIGAEEERKENCPAHGKYPVVHRFFGPLAGWMAPEDAECPQCIADRERRFGDRAMEKRRRAVLEEFRAADIPDRYRNAVWERSAESDSIFDDCMAYLEAFDAVRKVGGNIVFCGAEGTGKTLLACTMLRSLILEQGISGRYATAGDFLRRVKESYGNARAASEYTLVRELSGVGFLVLDEVGKSRGCKYEIDTLFDIINARYNALLPTLAITNLNLQSLAEFMGPYVFGRLRQNGLFCRFDWGSRR